MFFFFLADREKQQNERQISNTDLEKRCTSIEERVGPLNKFAPLHHYARSFFKNDVMFRRSKEKSFDGQ